MSKRVRVLAWMMVFVMLFVCACTVARSRKTGDRNKGGAHKPECETSETPSTPPAPTDPTDFTVPSITYQDITSLEEVIWLCKTCIGMDMGEATALISGFLNLVQYDFSDNYDDSLPYPNERILNGFSEPVLIDGVSFKRVSLWADDGMIVRDIEFDIREHELVYTEEDYANTVASDLYLPAKETNDILDSRMQLIYGSPDAEYDASWLGADPCGWHIWVDGTVQFFIFWGQDCVELEGNNTFTFGANVIEGYDDNSLSEYQIFAEGMSNILGLTESDADAKLESYFGIDLEPSTVTDDDTTGYRITTYTTPVTIGKVTFTSIMVYSEKDTKIVGHIAFFTDPVSSDEAIRYYDTFKYYLEECTVELIYESISEESDWTEYKSTYKMGGEREVTISRKTYTQDDTDNRFQIGFTDMNHFH